MTVPLSEPRSTNHGDLAGKIDERLEHCFVCADRPPGLGRLARLVDLELSFAVVAPAGRFEHGRAPQLFNRGIKFGRRSHGHKRRDGESGLA